LRGVFVEDARARDWRHGWQDRHAPEFESTSVDHNYSTSGRAVG